jgi:hypothetical protein
MCWPTQQPLWGDSHPDPHPPPLSPQVLLTPNSPNSPLLHSEHSWTAVERPPAPSTPSRRVRAVRSTEAVHVYNYDTRPDSGARAAAARRDARGGRRSVSPHAGQVSGQLAAEASMPAEFFYRESVPRR